MSKLGKRIREEREKRGWTQPQLAEMLDVDQSAISNVEIGRNKTIRKWRELADLFDIDHDEFKQLMVDSIQDQGKRTPRLLRPAEHNQSSTQATERGVPVYGRASGGHDGEYVFDDTILGWETRPPQLSAVPNSFATYIDGDSMYPRYMPGEVVWVDPNKPDVPGTDVVIQLRIGDDTTARRGFIKRLVRKTADKVIVEQFNPPKTIEIDAKDVLSIDRVVLAGRYP